MDPRHARRRHFTGGEDAGPYVASLGLNPASAVDLVFTTNLEVVRVEIPEGEQPPAHLKDCHVRFQGFRTQNPIRLFLFRLISLMQACAVEGGH